MSRAKTPNAIAYKHIVHSDIIANKHNLTLTIYCKSFNKTLRCSASYFVNQENEKDYDGKKKEELNDPGKKKISSLENIHSDKVIKKKIIINKI